MQRFLRNLAAFRELNERSNTSVAESKSIIDSSRQLRYSLVGRLAISKLL
jgi:hypothetical protein